MYLSLKQQLKEFFEMHHTDVLYPNTREKRERWALEDIFDGSVYKMTVKDSASNHTISINFSIDSTPLFKSSHTSITPILCTINELHPNQRKKNVMLVSVFSGSKKPPMNEYLKPFVAEMTQLGEDGFDYVFNGIRYHKVCKALVGITDSVERPELRGTTTFRGTYGCGLCKHPGIETPKGKGSVRVYPVDNTGNAFGEGLRTHDETLQHAENKEKGVKRRSTLCEIPEFDIIKKLPADWMHNSGLRVFRQFGRI